MALGVIDNREDADFTTMYHGSAEWFVRQEYYYDVRTIEQCNEVLCIRGTMGTTHQVQ